MKCPVDGTTLAMTTREGVEIDYCPQCRGIWLDRGELDKIVEREGASAAVGNGQPAQYSPADQNHGSQQVQRQGFFGRMFGDEHEYRGGHGHHD